MTENADGLTVHLTLTAVPNSPRVPISISKTDSPSDLRRKTAEATKIPLETLRIIFRGRLIAEQSETNVVDEFKLEEGCVIHCMGKPVVGDSVMVASTAASADPSAMTRSGTPPGADPAPPALVDPLETSLMTIRNSYSVDVFLAATSMLEKILQNIVSHPMEEKYRKVKRENGAFQRRLGGLRGGHDAMLAVGFTVTDTDGEASYVMQASPEAWPKLVTAIAFTSQWTRNNQAATVASAPSAVASMPFMNPGNLTPAGIESAAQMLSDPQALQSILQVRFNILCAVAKSLTGEIFYFETYTQPLSSKESNDSKYAAKRSSICKQPHAAKLNGTTCQ